MAKQLISKIEINLQKAENFLYMEEIEACFVCCETVEQLMFRLKKSKQETGLDTNFSQKLAGIKRRLNRVMIAKVKERK